MRDDILPVTRPAGHPFRDAFRVPPAIAAAAREDKDLKLFVLSFTAFFVCFYSFIF